MVPDWVKMGHCHEGYWCGDAFALKAFQAAMKHRYAKVARLNRAWGSDYRSFDEIRPPKEIADEKFKPSPAAFPTPQDKRRWLDFITWYHQAIIDFAEQSIRTVLKYFPAEKVRLKPGGNATGVNPIAWGTYCPGLCEDGAALPHRAPARRLPGRRFRRQVGGHRLPVLWRQRMHRTGRRSGCAKPLPAGCSRMLRAARPSSLRMSSRATRRISRSMSTSSPGSRARRKSPSIAPPPSIGSAETCKPPSTPAIRSRDLCEFDVLDEMLIADGALTTKRYRAFILFQAGIVEQPILDKIDAFRRAGGKVIAVGNAPIKNVDGQSWAGASRLARVAPVGNEREWLKELAIQLAGYRGVDGQLDGIWTCRRHDQVFVFNSTAKPAETRIDGQVVKLAPYAIWCSQPVAPKN